MHKLLIVDDEANLVDSLADFLSQSFQDITILKAHSGQEAMEILNLFHIDLIISDIKMPGMSGFDLLSFIEELFPKSHVIFLSAFAEFSWAQQALRHPCCVDYILKTQGDQIIFNAVQKQLALLNESRKLCSTSGVTGNREESIESFDQNNLVQRLSMKEIDVDDADCTGIICMFACQDDNISKYRFIALIRSFAVEYFPAAEVAVGYMEDDCACLLRMDTEAYNALFRSLFGRVEQVVDQMISAGYNVNCVFNSKLLTLGKMQHEIKHLQEVRRAIPNDEQGIIIDALHDRNKISLDEEYTIKRIKEYICDNLADENLSLSTIGRKMHYAPAYLSRMFKQKTGATMMTYISQIRINRACELLKEGSHSIREVAQIIGITSPSYFSAFFRRYTGMTPSQYARANMEM